ncbi:MAG: hypothetical protein U9Q74_02970, partial [Gemmatimonadota bacterium]|nr:hypothetical protein [Gemmatimonadota bacterium]
MPRPRRSPAVRAGLAAVLATVLVACGARTSGAQGSVPAADAAFAAVRPVLSGARALETVAYLDRFV